MVSLVRQTPRTVMESGRGCQSLYFYLIYSLFTRNVLFNYCTFPSTLPKLQDRMNQHFSFPFIFFFFLSPSSKAVVFVANSAHMIVQLLQQRERECPLPSVWMHSHHDRSKNALWLEHDHLHSVNRAERSDWVQHPFLNTLHPQLADLPTPPSPSLSLSLFCSSGYCQGMSNNIEGLIAS